MQLSMSRRDMCYLVYFIYIIEIIIIILYFVWLCIPLIYISLVDREILNTIPSWVAYEKCYDMRWSNLDWYLHQFDIIDRVLY